MLLVLLTMISNNAFLRNHKVLLLKLEMKIRKKTEDISYHANLFINILKWLNSNKLNLDPNLSKTSSFQMASSAKNCPISTHQKARKRWILCFIKVPQIDKMHLSLLLLMNNWLQMTVQIQMPHPVLLVFLKIKNKRLAWITISIVSAFNSTHLWRERAMKNTLLSNRLFVCLVETASSSHNSTSLTRLYSWYIKTGR